MLGLIKRNFNLLTALKLPTWKYRRIRGDMIEVYKLLTNTYDDNTVQLDMNSDTKKQRTHQEISCKEMPI